MITWTSYSYPSTHISSNTIFPLFQKTFPLGKWKPQDPMPILLFDLYAIISLTMDFRDWTGFFSIYILNIADTSTLMVKLDNDTVSNLCSGSLMTLDQTVESCKQQALTYFYYFMNNFPFRKLLSFCHTLFTIIIPWLFYLLINIILRMYPKSKPPLPEMWV